MFTAERLARLAQIERWHFWFVGRKKLVEQLMEKYLETDGLVLDVGCGTGYMLETLNAIGYQSVGIDRRAEGLTIAKRNFRDAKLIQADVTQIPLANEQIAAAILLDVIEHVDDYALLCELHRLLEAGSIVIITTPAMPWLWSYRDDAAGHVRRYTPSHLRRLLTQTGFGVLDIRYYQFFLFPLVILTRLFGRKGSQLRDIEDLPPRTVNRIFAAINRMEASLSEYIRLPWGSSLVAVCKKP
jgi:ubiquinone/menaquinone biosynthesis C-methylase UbiE